MISANIMILKATTFEAYKLYSNEDIQAIVKNAISIRDMLEKKPSLLEFSTKLKIQKLFQELSSIKGINN